MEVDRVLVIHVVGGLGVDSGGPARTVTSLCDSVASKGVETRIVTMKGADEELVFPSSRSVEVRYVVRRMNDFYRIRFLIVLLRIVGVARKENRRVIIHDHGVWGWSNFCSFVVSKRFKVPLFLHPRGMLEPWSLQYRRIKKLVAMFVYQSRILRSVTLFIATSEQEAENIRALKYPGKIRVVPNGVHNLGEDKLSCEYKSAEPKTALFLSRIHPKKGLEMLLSAWRDIKPRGWRLLIAGPSDEKYLTKISTLVADNFDEGSVELLGPVYGNEKSELFKRCDLFVLPTFSENFGVVVVEALSYGIPVITTRAAPWGDIEKFDCGWWVDANTESLLVAISAATSLQRSELRAMGRRGLQVAKKYDWDAIGMQMVSIYCSET